MRGAAVLRARDDSDLKPQGEQESAAVDENQKYPSQKLIKQTLDLWQPRTERKLTEEDAREMIENVVGYFRLLQESSKARKARRSKKPSLRIV